MLDTESQYGASKKGVLRMSLVLGVGVSLAWGIDQSMPSPLIILLSRLCQSLPRKHKSAYLTIPWDALDMFLLRSFELEPGNVIQGRLSMRPGKLINHTTCFLTFRC